MEKAAESPADASSVLKPRVALLPWGLLYEDFLDTMGVSLEAFRTEMTGGYLFNYVEALRASGIDAFIVIVSARIRRATRETHVPTGATLLMLPPTRFYLSLRWVLGKQLVQRFLSRLPSIRRLSEEIAAYISTPITSMQRELRKDRCSAVVCQEYEYPRFDALVAIGRKLGVPVFATFQGANGPGGLLQRLIRPISLRHCAGLFIGPRKEVARVRERYGLPESKISRVFNPVGPETFESIPAPEARSALDLPQAARIAVWYGRVERHVKGLDVLLDAWVRICREQPDQDLRLLMIGTGNDAGWLKQRLQASDVRGVHWRDEYVHDRRILRLYLSAADVYAFPSRREGFPVAPIEAMACGLPVVAAAAPGVPDILEGEDQAGGTVVPCGDVEAFARALGQLLADPDRSRLLGERAKRRAQEVFSLEAVGSQMRSFLVQGGMITGPAEPEVIAPQYE